MDIYRFINSKDVSEHLREIGYEFTAMEAAYLVEMCDDATLDERIGAWQEIIEAMPDCPMTRNHNVEKRGSTHEFLREYIDLQRRMLDMFEEGAGCVYLPLEFRRVPEHPGWPGDDDGNLWVEERPKPFSTLEKCVEYLRLEFDDSWDAFDRYRISKTRIDFVGEPYEYRQNEVLDGRFRPMSVSVDGLSESEKERAWHLGNSFLKIPVPFKRGDIVVDRTSLNPHPFVFDHLKFWSSEELAAHGHEALSSAEAKKLDERVARRDERGSWDDSHMVACGYELGAHYGGGPLDDPCDLCFDVFGASYNYLNLERYDGPLEGRLKVLEIASQFMKGETGVDLFLNSTCLTDIACHAKKLERSYGREYVPEVRHLYQGGEL